MVALFVMMFPFFGLACLFAAFTAWIANTKGRNIGGWLVLGLFFGPLAMLAVGLAGSDDLRRAVPMQREPERVPAILPSAFPSEGQGSRTSTPGASIERGQLPLLLRIVIFLCVSMLLLAVVAFALSRRA